MSSIFETMSLKEILELNDYELEEFILNLPMNDAYMLFRILKEYEKRFDKERKDDHIVKNDLVNV